MTLSDETCLLLHVQLFWAGSVQQYLDADNEQSVVHHKTGEFSKILDLLCWITFRTQIQKVTYLTKITLAANKLHLTKAIVKEVVQRHFRRESVNFSVAINVKIN
ncbi:hypothetical protein A9R01_04085 ['Osedax' symbiont bacterium Rs2_46_30_T18]|nr:hypothetical protein A9R01_04085 ['Osedax' symbiont bacterium Rs2_46_30_T18]